MTKPVNISGDAHRDLANLIRKWSGWPGAALVFGEPIPEVSPYAMTEQDEQRFTINANMLVLNPNRVLRTITPFRLRQEAVLTGVMLHEAAHARFSRWRPTKPGQTWTHDDTGEPVTKAEASLACLMEEARIEGLMALKSEEFGADGLDWTIRASAAALLPMTSEALAGATIMDLIKSWALRAGRQIALTHTVHLTQRTWVNDFNALLQRSLVDHCREVSGREVDGITATQKLIEMVKWDGKDTGLSDDPAPDNTESWMVDMARDVLALLYPDGGAPEAGGGCAMPSQIQGQSGAEGDDQGSGGGSDPSEDDSPGDGESESGIGASDTDDEGSGKGEEPWWAQDLRHVENEGSEQCRFESKEKQGETPPKPSMIKSAGGGDGGAMGGWREPDKDERGVAANAEKFLRDLINPSESSTVTVTDQPSATVDGAALSAWRAAGARTDPKFFRRTRREVEPTPPVKIAVLVDVSSSMSALQKPSALLSWALASAALDLRNFAGRGAQVSSCLIHWGTAVEVVQGVGGTLPGIREVPCNQGTRAMDRALALVEEQIPDFFTVPSKPENRLLVQFTDWELYGSLSQTTQYVSRALEAGVTMLTVAPPSGLGRSSRLATILRECPIQRGHNTVINYSDSEPHAVWDEAARMLR
jgi:hypothetical protein